MRVVIHVLYAYCQSYSDIRGYSDKGGGEGGRVVIRVLYAYCQSYSDIHGYSDKGRGGKGGNPRTLCVLSELLWISEWTADKTQHHWTCRQHEFLRPTIRH